MFGCTKVRPHRTDTIHKEAEEYTFEQLHEEEEEAERLGSQDDEYPQPPGAELPVREMPAARSLAPLVHPTSTPSVVGGLAAASSSSLGNSYLKLFFVCQAKLGPRWCGTHMPFELWKLSDRAK